MRAHSILGTPETVSERRRHIRRSRRRSSPSEGTLEDLPTVHPRRPSVLDYRRRLRGGSSSQQRQEEKVAKARHPPQSSSSEEEGPDNPEKELFPLGHYINDPRAMIKEVFSVIRGSKLDAMLTANLREMTLEELKESCLQQLEGMSKKRIRCILQGQEMEESSETEEDDEEEDQVIPPLESKSWDQSSGHEEDDGKAALKSVPISSPLDDDETDEGQAGSTREGKERSKGDESSENKRDPTSYSLKKIDVHLKKGSSEVNRSGPSEEMLDGETSSMELLELEMRARAIKALLGKSEKAPEIKINLSQGEEDLPEDEERKKSRREESIRRRKAREALEISEAKKREETEKRERKQREMLERIEEHAQEMRVKGAQESRRREEEAERLRVKRMKEEEHQKFLKWKEEKLLREERLKLEKLRREKDKERQSLKRNLDNLRKSDEASSRDRPSERLLAKKTIDKNKYRRKTNRSSSEEKGNHVSQVDKFHSPVSSEEDEVLRRTSEFEDGEVDSDGQVPKAPEAKKRHSHVFIADDSDQEKILSSSEEGSIHESSRLGKKRSKKERKSKSRKRRAKSETNDKGDDKLEENEEEVKAREELERIEKERRDKLHKERLQRVQAFQERTEILDSNNSPPNEEDEEKEALETSSKAEAETNNEFYTSYIADKNKSSSPKVSEANPEDCKDAGDPHIPPPVKKTKIAKIDGVAQVAKLCEAQGDFETKSIPPPSSKPEDSKVVEEEEPQTWADRWYQDKNVQKVVKESKALSKVRNNLKMKLESQKGPPKDVDPQKLEEVVSTLPDVSTLGSIQQYAKIVGKTVDDIDKSRVDPEDPGVFDYDDDEISLGGGDEDLWGDIMGTNNE